MSRHRRGGFFIIWGSKNRITSDHAQPLDTVCPSCREQTRIVGKVHKRWFTLYFLPLYPMEGGERFSECTRCKAQFQSSVDELRQRLGSGGRAPVSFQSAIVLFNEMRETPADAKKLAMLLGMYLELGEPREALSAGRTYPKAMEVSDECLARMAVASERLGDRDGAVRYAAAALAINPNQREAMAVAGGSGVTVG